MKKLGLVGYRGMVGSVLMQRMQEEQDFNKVTTTFFSTSQKGQKAPQVANLANELLQDAYDLDALCQMDIILTCQGGDYTSAIYDKLKQRGYKGYFIDAASTLRMQEDSVIILDPINQDLIDRALNNNIKAFIGGNCTVSLMLMALGGLFKENLISWVSSSTYQAASGAGAKNMRELLVQMGQIYNCVKSELEDENSNILTIEKKVRDCMNSPSFITTNFTQPLAGSVLPWIDKAMENGQSKEEWKGMAETNKILGLAPGSIPVDGNCVRISSLRCHSQSLTIKLNKNVPIHEIEQIIKNHNPYVRLIENDKEQTLAKLTPAYVSGKLEVPIGRIRKMMMGDDYLSAFTVGDQLLWGAAEPLRRMLDILTRA